MVIAALKNKQKQKEIQLLNNFIGPITQLKELLKKEVAIKFVLLERCNNMKAENEKLRDIIGKSNPFEAPVLKKNVGCQSSISSS